MSSNTPQEIAATLSRIGTCGSAPAATSFASA